MKLQQLKQQAAEQGLTPQQVRKYGDLRKKCTWEKALEKGAKGWQKSDMPNQAIADNLYYSQWISYWEKNGDSSTRTAIKFKTVGSSYESHKSAALRGINTIKPATLEGYDFAGLKCGGVAKPRYR